MTDKTQTATMPNQPNIPTFATDSDAIRYATLSDDPLTRRLAELAAAAEPWHDLPEWISEGGPDAIEEIDQQHSSMINALNQLNAWDDMAESVDYAMVEYYRQLDEDARSGKIQYAEDCPCTEDGEPGLADCPECKGAGFTTEPVELP